MPSPQSVTFAAKQEIIDKLDAMIPERGLNRSEVIRSLIEGESGYTWIAYPEIGDEYTPFGSSEVDALRYAVGRGWRTVRVPHGSSIRGSIRAAQNPQRG